MIATPSYLLDTTVLIALSRAREPAASWSRGIIAGPDDVGVSAVTVAEFFAGLRPEERPRWVAFLASLTHWDVSREIAIRAGAFRYDLARRGRTILIPDALIAATAATVGLVLVTDNVKDYPMPELNVLRLGFDRAESPSVG